MMENNIIVVFSHTHDMTRLLPLQL